LFFDFKEGIVLAYFAYSHDSQNTLYPKCALCRATPQEGIAGGQMAARRFFCNGCVEKMMSLSPADPSYDYMLGHLDGFGAAILRCVYRKGG
jgi:hypothetical protein